MTYLLEHWKPVVGYEGLYAVTNTGRVVSLRSGKYLKQHQASGYFRVSLSHRGHTRHLLLHRVVAAAFLGAPLAKLTVNHMNGWKSCNVASNLEYLTNHANTLHAVALGINNRGERHGRAKLNDAKVREIRELALAMPLSQIAERFGINVSNVARAVNREQWKHVL